MFLIPIICVSMFLKCVKIFDCSFYDVSRHKNLELTELFVISRLLEQFLVFLEQRYVS